MSKNGRKCVCVKGWKSETKQRFKNRVIRKLYVYESGDLKEDRCEDVPNVTESEERKYRTRQTYVIT